MGCFNYTNPAIIKYDFATTDSYLNANSYNPLEIDDCIDVCKALKKQYAHMIYYSFQTCGCSNSYNNYSSSVDNYNCNFPCSIKNSIGTNRCPKQYYYSSFQI